MTENHKTTAQPRPTTESQRFRGKIDIVRIGNKHIVPPTNQYSVDPSAQTNPKKCKPTMIEMMGRRNRLRSSLLKKRPARKIRTASKAIERLYAFPLNVAGCAGEIFPAAIMTPSEIKIEIERNQENQSRLRLRVPAAIQTTAKIETTIAPISID